MELLRCLYRATLLRAAAVVLAVGWTPLLLYVLWEKLSGQTGGNPIGLGLLMVAATLLGVLLLVLGLLQGLWARLRGAPSGGSRPSR